MATEKKGQAPNIDFFSVMDHVEEQKKTLWTTWMANGRQDFGSVVRMAIQEVERLKSRNPEWNVSIPYLWGRLDGYTELFERLYREEQRVYAAAECLTPQTPKVRQILLYLYQNDGARHGDIATSIGSSYSSLTNIMKKVLLSGTVEAVRSGRNTCYHLTEAGRQYCERSLHSNNGLTQMIREIVRETIQTILETMEENGLPTQRVQVGEKITPIVDNEIQNPITVDRIIKMGNKKFAECSNCVENTEEEEPKLERYLSTSWPQSGYVQKR